MTESVSLSFAALRKTRVGRFEKVVERIASRGIAVRDLLEREFVVLIGLVIAF